MVVENIIPQHLDALLMKLDEIGIDLEVDVDRVIVKGMKDTLKGTAIKTKPYPGFATDIQQPLTTLLTQAQGQSIITETIYPERFKHCGELKKMGAKIDVMVPSCFINGPTKLSGTEVVATDLRCGAALVVAGLIADGITEIHDVYHIDRGYENLDGKLSDPRGKNLERNNRIKNSEAVLMGAASFFVFEHHENAVFCWKRAI